LTPFYEYIFQKLKDSACDWKYSFPRIYIIDFAKDFDNSVNDKINEYDPENAVKEQIKSTKRQRNIQVMQGKLNMLYKEQHEEAKYKPLNPIVRAYKNIFGKVPVGHPQRKIE